MESSRKYFVGGNWKSNGTLEKNRALLTDVINALDFDTKKVGKPSSKILYFTRFAVHPDFDWY